MTYAWSAQNTVSAPLAQIESVPPSALQPINRAEGFVATTLPVALALFAGVMGIWFIRSFLCICKPNEVVILSGRKWKTSEGHEIGYRVLSGGRAIRIPILETIRRMDVTTIPLRLEVRNAYSKGGTPLNIQAIANVKISSDPAVVGNAIERFLDCDRSEIARVARETLEGNLRGVVATLTPEQVNEDRLQFAERIASDVQHDLIKLGLQIDTLKIQNVSDDVDYLRSIGRKQIALVIRNAEIAEAEAVGQADRIEAECEQQAQVAQTQNRIVVLEQENDLRTVKAKLEQQARSAEEVTTATVEESRAKFEQTLQAVRTELERLRLEADTVLPADARRQSQELKARGAAAPLAENAKAAALVNEMLAQVWQELGADAAELYLIQQLEAVLQEVVQIPKRLHLNDVSVVDNGDGQSLASLVRVYPEVLQQFLISVNQTLGIDIVGLLNAKLQSTLAIKTAGEIQEVNVSNNA